MLRKISIALLLLLLIAGGIYAVFLFGGKKSTPTTEGPAVSVDGSVVLMDPLPAEEPESLLNAVTSEEAFDYWINRLDGQIYYITTEGIVKRADKSGNPSVISSSRFNGGVGGVIASPRGDAVLISSADLVAPEFKLFDVERSLWRALPAGTTSASWSPSSPTNEVAFLKTSSKKDGSELAGSLNIYNVTKGTSRQILELPYYDLLIDWLTPSTIALSQKPSREVSGSLWLYDIQKKTLRTLLADRKGFWLNWQATGSINYDVEHGLYLLNAQGAQTPLPFFSFPSKCTQEGLRLYCAVPQGRIAEEALPDSYIQMAVMTDDVLTSTSLAELPRLPSSRILLEKKKGLAIDAWHLTKSGPKLYFINRYDQKVYSLRVLAD